MRMGAGLPMRMEAWLPMWIGAWLPMRIAWRSGSKVRAGSSWPLPIAWLPMRMEAWLPMWIGAWLPLRIAGMRLHGRGPALGAGVAAGRCCLALTLGARVAARERLHGGCPTLGTRTAIAVRLLRLHAGAPVGVLLHILIVAGMGTRWSATLHH